MEIRIEPIDEAPATPGVPSGPYLLAPGHDSDWTVGEWDGRDWCDASGFIIAPILFALLPALLG